jgi:hypothetical protein
MEALVTIYESGGNPDYNGNQFMMVTDGVPVGNSVIPIDKYEKPTSNVVDGSGSDYFEKDEKLNDIEKQLNNQHIVHLANRSVAKKYSGDTFRPFYKSPGKFTQASGGGKQYGTCAYAGASK